MGRPDVPGSVLVVEDDAELAATLLEALETAGFSGKVASDGREALAALDEKLPDVILLDLMMPVMDGWEFRERQKKHARASAVPVIVMTAGGRVEEKAHELGAAGFVGKPVSLGTLITEVERVLPCTGQSRRAEPPGHS